MESARARVIAAGLVLHDTEKLRVTVVFDGKGEAVGLDEVSGSPLCRVLYAPASMTADDLIEQLVGAASTPGEITVATGDRHERHTIEALGATAISPELLRAWVERCEARQTARVKRRSDANPFTNTLPL